ncbi:MAG: hypothetical protein QME68_07990, partial [Elusimicrobiota bacterium]|nr:hypothetical protein [Elusimicrobiota bacterium]
MKPMKHLLTTASSSLNLKLTEVVKHQPKSFEREMDMLADSEIPHDEFNIKDISLTQAITHPAPPLPQLNIQNIQDTPVTDRPAFEFINETNIDKLTYIQKNAPIDDIVLTCAYLRPDLVSRFLESLDGKRIEIFKRLLVPQEPEPEKVKQLERTLRRKISFFFGGINHAVKILEECPEEDQNLLLKELQDSDLEKFQQIRSQIILFEDITNAPEEVFVKVARAVGDPRKIATCLCDLPQETITRIINSLRRN